MCKVNGKKCGQALARCLFDCLNFGERRQCLIFSGDLRRSAGELGDARLAMIVVRYCGWCVLWWSSCDGSGDTSSDASSYDAVWIIQGNLYKLEQTSTKTVVNHRACVFGHSALPLGWFLETEDRRAIHRAHTHRIGRAENSKKIEIHDHRIRL